MSKMIEILLKEIVDKLSAIERIENSLASLKQYADSELKKTNDRVNIIEERNSHLEK